MPTAVLLSFWMNGWGPLTPVVDTKGLVSLRDTTVFTAVGLDRAPAIALVDLAVDPVVADSPLHRVTILDDVGEEVEIDDF